MEYKNIESSVFIIAEAGVNHNGNIQIAKRLVDEAVLAGADAIKFQSFKAENMVCKNAPKADYQLLQVAKLESQYEMLKKLELTYEMHKKLIEYCKYKNIMFLSTPFDIESMELLADLKIEIFKIPSGEITNYPYLKKIATYNKNIILSTGMSTMKEIKSAIDILKENGANNISILHCTTEYPVVMEEVNLKAMNSIHKQTGLKVGYSDHTLGFEVAIAAVAIGATIIEKHFTLDKSMKGPDHKASLEPCELRSMIRAIRNIEKVMGNGIKMPTKSELKNINIVRKSIVASREIKRGEHFTEDNITTKRPGDGMSPMRWNEILGKVAKRDYIQDDIIEKEI